jgi:hypothetical protein
VAKMEISGSIVWREAGDAYISLGRFDLMWGFPALKLVIDELWKKVSRSTIMTALSRKLGVRYKMVK